MAKKPSNTPNKLEKIIDPFEKFTDKAVPYLAILLALIIIAELTIKEIEHYEPYITALDYFIVSFFILDLIFKWLKIRKIKKFIKLYWLDLLAVFPFYLIIRVYLRITTLIRAGEEIAEIQKFAHEAALIREAKLIEGLEKETKIMKEIRPTLRIIKVLQRFLRIRRAKSIISLKTALHIHASHNKKIKNKIYDNYKNLTNPKSTWK